MRRTADVRQQHDVIHREQRCGNVRLVREDIETGALDCPVLQRIDERRLVDDRAARDIDQDAFLAERCQHLGVDEVARRRAAGARDDEKIDIRRQRFQVGQEAIRNVLRLAAGISDLHPQRAYS